MRRVGLISDTHGLLRPQALAFLHGCDAIVHGGDICGANVLAELGRIAPVTAVRGNNDRGAWADALRDSELVKFGNAWVYAIHDLAQLELDPPGAGVHVVVSGHSHKPMIAERDGVLYVNSGSAGPRRFKLPIAIGELLIDGRSIEARVVELDVQADASTRTKTLAAQRLVIEPR